MASLPVDAAGNSARTPDDRVYFGLLGPLLVTEREGSRICIPAAKQRGIMAALLLNANMTVPAEQLSDMLWGPSPPPSAASAIRTYVTRLRRVLGKVGMRLVSRSAGYAIEVRESGEFDLGELEHLRAESRNAARQGDSGQVVSLCRQALSLWRGAPLEDIPPSALQASEASRLTELQFEFTTARIDAELQLGMASHLVAELRQLVDRHPLREHAQAQLMLAYYQSGRQADALATYRRVRAILARELGIEPGPELSTLHQLILAADPALQAIRLNQLVPTTHQRAKGS